MRREMVVAGTVAVLIAIVLGVVAYDAGMVELPGEDTHDRATVTIIDENGTTLATVNATVADTRKERVQGLSGTESLANGSGMLFVHSTEDRRAYVMQEMNYPLDIIFVGADNRITVIHNASVPPEDAEELERYFGVGKWVLEVPRGYAAAHGIDEGDRIEIEYGE